MAMSASNIKKAQENINGAWRLLLKECQSRKWDTREEVERIERIMRDIEKVEVALSRHLCKTYGFEFWKAEAEAE